MRNTGYRVRLGLASARNDTPDLTPFYLSRPLAAIFARLGYIRANSVCVCFLRHLALRRDGGLGTTVKEGLASHARAVG